MTNEIRERLLAFQVPHVERLLNALERFPASLDSSDTGTGKTYSALAIANSLQLKPVVIAPRAIKQGWYIACKHFGIDNVYISNIEQYKLGNSPYARKVSKNLWEFRPNALDGRIVIVDESHCLKSFDTQNVQFLIQLREAFPEVKILYLSATMCENPLHLRFVGSDIGLFPANEFYSWSYRAGLRYVDRTFFNPKTKRKEIKKIPEFSELNAREIHQVLFPTGLASRMRKSDSNAFKECHILVDPITVASGQSSLQKELVEIKELSEIARTTRNTKQALGENLGRITTLRKSVEQRKLKTIWEIARDKIEEGSSVAIFLNFVDNVKEMGEMMNRTTKTELIYGAMNMKARNESVDNFQSDRSRCIILTIDAGGQSISLHDLNGRYSRYSIISPTWNAISMKQALGRVDRANAKTPSTQRIVYASGTLEELVANRVGRKIKNIDRINDGDLN